MAVRRKRWKPKNNNSDTLPSCVGSGHKINITHYNKQFISVACFIAKIGFLLYEANPRVVSVVTLLNGDSVSQCLTSATFNLCNQSAHSTTFKLINQSSVQPIRFRMSGVVQSLTVRNRIAMFVTVAKLSMTAPNGFIFSLK